MKSRLFFSALLAVACLSQAGAQQQTLTFKDGSKLTGYISAQGAGLGEKGNLFTVSTTRAEVMIPKSKIKSKMDRVVKERDLSKPWVDWANETHAFKGYGDSRELMLADIVTNDRTYTHVRILENGDTVRFLEIADDSFTCKWDELSSWVFERRDPMLLTGVNHAFTLNDGSVVEGQLVEKLPGKCYKVLDNNGIVQVVNAKNVIKETRKKLSADDSFYSQSDQLDRLILTKGAPVEGLITELTYNKGANNFLLIEDERGNSSTVDLSNVSQYQRIANKAYKPKVDVILKKGEILINKKKATTKQVVEQKPKLIIENFNYRDTANVRLKAKSFPMDVMVEANLANPEVIKRCVMIKASKYENKPSGKNNKKSKDVVTSYGFSYEDIVTAPISPKSIETTVNNTSRLLYTLSEPGIYVIYDPVVKKAIPLIVE